jgi:hypothetical protein
VGSFASLSAKKMTQHIFYSKANYSLPFHALSASWRPSRLSLSTVFSQLALVKAGRPRLSYTKAASNTSRKVLDKLVDAALEPSGPKNQTYASVNNHFFDDQFFSRIGVLFSTQRRRAL